MDLVLKFVTLMKSNPIPTQISTEQLGKFALSLSKNTSCSQNSNFHNPLIKNFNGER